MFIAYTNRERTEYKVFSTELEAAQWLIDDLNGDYNNKFWIDEDRKFQENSARLDFGMSIYENVEEVFDMIENHGDEEFMAEEKEKVLSAVADFEYEKNA